MTTYHTYHCVHAEIADQIGGRLPAEHVVESRALERVAGVQVDDGGRPGAFGVQRAAQPSETAVAAGLTARAVSAVAASLVKVRMKVVGVQHGQPELAGSRRRRRHRRRLKQSQRYGRDHRTALRRRPLSAPQPRR